MDVLPFILEAEDEAGVGGLGLFYCTFGEGFNSRRPDREFIVDPHLFGFGTPDEFSEVVVSPCHLDPDVELLECLTGRRFICFLTDYQDFAGCVNRYSVPFWTDTTTHFILSSKIFQE